MAVARHHRTHNNVIGIAQDYHLNKDVVFDSRVMQFVKMTPI